MARVRVDKEMVSGSDKGIDGSDLLKQPLVDVLLSKNVNSAAAWLLYFLVDWSVDQPIVASGRIWPGDQYCVDSGVGRGWKFLSCTGPA